MSLHEIVIPRGGLIEKQDESKMEGMKPGGFHYVKDIRIKDGFDRFYGMDVNEIITFF